MSLTEGTLAGRLRALRAWWPLHVVLAWLGTRLAVLWLLGGRHAWVTGDLDYFAASLEAVPRVGLAATLIEYPLPGVVVVALPWLLVEWLGLPGTYEGVVVGLSLVADAAFTATLAVLGGRGRGAGLVVWLLGVPLLGATVYARFDLVPGLLVGVAFLGLTTWPRLAGALAALATGLKLWPALLLPVLTAPRATRSRALVAVTATGLVLVAGTVALAGAPRLFTPLTWQSERGLQVEAVAATPFMLARLVAPGSHQVAFTEHNAFEVSGPGVGEALLVTELLGLLLAPALLLVWSVAWRRGRLLTTDAVAWMCLAAVAAFLVTSKVLSPQYLLWLLPLTAATLAVAGSRELRTWAWGLLVATAATQVVFPERYADLVEPVASGPWGTWALVLRNAVLVGLTVRAASLAVRELGSAVGGEDQRGIAEERHPPGPAG